jgi:hypothetical protein
MLIKRKKAQMYSQCLLQPTSKQEDCLHMTPLMLFSSRKMQAAVCHCSKSPGFALNKKYDATAKTHFLSFPFCIYFAKAA